MKGISVVFLRPLEVSFSGIADGVVVLHLYLGEFFLSGGNEGDGKHLFSG